METAIIFAFIGGFIVLIIVVILVSRHLDKKRTEAIEAFANEIGLAFHPQSDGHLESRLGSFQLFSSGRKRVLRNAIIGETDVAKIAIFDYQYTTGSGKHQHTHHQTVVGMEFDNLDIPAFMLRPENLFDWFGSMFGVQDIDFDEHPEFSKMFVLKGDDEQAVREFFDVPLLDFFAQHAGIAFECAPGKFIYFRSGKKAKVEDLKKLLEEGYAVYSAFTERMQRR